MIRELIPGVLPAELVELAHTAHGLVAQLGAIIPKIDTASESRSVAEIAHMRAQQVARGVDQLIGRLSTEPRP